MRNEHTKGPWVYSPRLDEGYRVHGIEGMVDAIADINEWHNPEETEANIRLIAAAPALYEACKDALSTFCSTSYIHKAGKTITSEAFFENAMNSIAILKSALALAEKGE